MNIYNLESQKYYHRSLVSTKCRCSIICKCTNLLCDKNLAQSKQ